MAEPREATNAQPIGIDAAVAAGLALVLGVVYAALIQLNLTYDGAFFAYEELQPVRHHLAPHLIFGPWLRGVLWVGNGFAISPRVAGSLQSAGTMALAIALFYMALRRCAVSRPWGVLFSPLMGLNAPWIENATSVECYGVTMFAVMLSLHAFLSETRSPSARGAIFLLIANMLVVWAHIGFSFWVLSVYIALGIREGSGPRILTRLAQGFAVLAALMATEWIANQFGSKASSEYDFMLTRFFRPQTLLSHLLNALIAPSESIQAFAGLALVPAALGLRLAWRRHRALALHTLVATLLFVAFYHAWRIDWGTFYLPAIVLLGIFAAIGCEAVFTGGGRSAQIILVIIALVTAAFIMLPYQDYSFIPRWINGWERRAPIAVLFYISVAAQWRLGTKLSKAETRQPHREITRASIIFACVAIALTLLCYLPRPIELLKPDEMHHYAAAVRKLAATQKPGTMRLITCFQPRRVELDTGVKSCSSNEIGIKADEQKRYGPNRAAEWIRAANSLDVWIDSAAMLEARTLWPRGALKEIPIDSLSFEPVTIDSPTSRTFYRITPKRFEVQ